MENTEQCSHDFTGVEPNKGWFECKLCGSKMRRKDVELIMETANLEEKVIKTADGEAIVHPPAYVDEPELKMPKPKVEHTLSSGKVTTGNTVIIKCADCGTERTIKVQDAFQVKRCMPCQKKYRNHQRYLNRKAGESKAKAELKEG